MKITFIIQIILSILLITLVTLQSKDASLGSGFSSVAQSGFQTKRGPEKLMYIITIILAILFLTLSVLNITIFR